MLALRIGGRAGAIAAEVRLVPPARRGGGRPLVRRRAIHARVLAAAAALVIAVAGFSGSSGAQEVRQYVLALSWSPTYCSRADPERDRLQCDVEADHTFIVHGLWPDDGSADLNFCRTTFPDPSRREVDSMLDIMPSRGLVRHQWRKHGRCSGLTARDYFATVRAARERVAVPLRLATLGDPINVSPQVLRQAFRRLNPGLPDDGIMIACRAGTLVEVRVCLTPDLRFRSCLRRPRRCSAPMLRVQPPL